MYRFSTCSLIKKRKSSNAAFFALINQNICTEGALPCLNHILKTS